MSKGNLIYQKVHSMALFYKAHKTDAGYDLALTDTVRLAPGESKVVGTGVRVQLPTDTYGILTHRSSAPSKLGAVVVTGIIDQDYRGEIKCNMHNNGTNAVMVPAGYPVAQLVLVSLLSPLVREGTVTSDTERGEGGFGSTD